MNILDSSALGAFFLLTTKDESLSKKKCENKSSHEKEMSGCRCSSINNCMKINRNNTFKIFLNVRKKYLLQKVRQRMFNHGI